MSTCIEDMPRSRYARSACKPSSLSCASALTKSARMNRVRHGSSAAISLKRSSATGSRSIPISVPVGPRRSAISLAWPPPPKVQSTAVSPGCGSSRSINSPARTGMCVWVMSRSVAKPCCNVGNADQNVLAVAAVLRAVEHLEALTRAGDDDVLAQPGVLHEHRGDHHAVG